MDNAILVERRDKVGIITINRPEVRNALDKNTWRLLHGAFAELDNDPEVRVIVVTGAGEKAFVAGADLNSLKVRSSVETLYGETPSIVAAIESVKKPTIAAINWFALGGGLELAMACDIRIAGDGAKFGQTETNVGILPGYGGSQRLTRLVGLGKAKELIFTGKIISAQEAEKIGLINQVVPQAELLTVTMKMANEIAAKSPIITRTAKMIINRGAESDLDSGLVMERLAQSFAFSTEDHLEGINAFLEKRPAQFTGK